MRQELEEWWEKCFYSEKQKKEFKHFHDSKLQTLYENYTLQQST